MGPGFESPPGHHVGASCISLAPTFLQKSERTHSAAPPFQPRFASLDSRLVLDIDLKAGVSKVFTLSNSSQASYRLRRVFYAPHQKLIVRSFCCSSFPNRIRFAGFRFGFGCGTVACTSEVFTLSNSPQASDCLRRFLCTGHLEWHFCWQGKTLM